MLTIHTGITYPAGQNVAFLTPPPPPAITQAAPQQAQAPPQQVATPALQPSGDPGQLLKISGKVFSTVFCIANRCFLG